MVKKKKKRSEAKDLLQGTLEGSQGPTSGHFRMYMDIQKEAKDLLQGTLDTHRELLLSFEKCGIKQPEYDTVADYVIKDHAGRLANEWLDDIPANYPTQQLCRVILLHLLSDEGKLFKKNGKPLTLTMMGMA